MMPVFLDLGLESSLDLSWIPFVRLEVPRGQVMSLTPFLSPLWFSVQLLEQSELCKLPVEAECKTAALGSPGSENAVRGCSPASWQDL